MKAEARTTPSADRSWHGWLGGMASCFRSTPWPFPVSSHPELGLVRNVIDAPAPPKKRRTSMPRCTVWRPKRFVHESFYEDGPPRPEDTHTNYHKWADPKGRCWYCKRTRAQLLGQAASPDPMAAMATAGEPMSKTASTKPAPSKMAAPKMPPKGKAPPPKGKKAR